MSNEDVHEDLAKADVVVAKVDAHSQELLRQVNISIASLMLGDILEDIKLFRKEFQGKLCLQIMFIEANKIFAREIAQIASSLLPDGVQLNTPLRPCPVKPLTPPEMAPIKCEFDELGNVVTVYQTPKPEITPLNLAEFT
jgi:wyosine [tRNA(Phe)-imidazoG37] synthetase (radical SAM superfamily)